MTLIKFNYKNLDLEPYYFFGLEEYILNNLTNNNPDSYFFTWKIKGIVVGKYQVLEREINTKFVIDNSIKVFRRPTGGGAVYADNNNTMFSIISPLSETFSFQKELSKIVDYFKTINLNLEVSERNDILLDNQKISGNAFLKTKNGFLLHGTLLYDLDRNMMINCLNPSKDKYISKGIQSISKRITNLKEHTSINENDLVDGLRDFLCQDSCYTLSSEEEKIVVSLSKKYKTKKFVYHNDPLYTITYDSRFKFGNLIFSFLVEKRVIKDLNINGDFFVIDKFDEFKNSFKGVLFTKLEMIKNINKFNVSEIFLGSTNLELEEFINTFDILE
ncbi:MAG: lipoate--protein ligase [Acholeplasmatales bacterium]|jgi:lipoate-protein ligase A|nr:lipoate--protein ligase [Acholeplasmatales bacterium]